MGVGSMNPWMHYLVALIATIDIVLGEVDR